ncbi:MAG: hypothetical protein MJ252_05605, partial [archaeon]|nr:hypothetical protein [archaeon]
MLRFKGNQQSLRESNHSEKRNISGSKIRNKSVGNIDNKKYKTKKKSKSISKTKESEYDKYNIEQLRYKAENMYSKMNFSEEPFLNRMKYYSMKLNRRDDCINEIIKKMIPKVPQERIIKTLNRVIDDSNRRVEKFNTNKNKSNDN